MNSIAKNPDEYLASLTDERKKAITKLRKVILENIPNGFSEEISYGMIGYVVPHTLYPKGYHCNPTLPLPFVNIASQKNYISIYHMGLYGSSEQLSWFQEKWKQHSNKKLNMGKSCIRFKNEDDIPFELIGELMTKLNPQKWIEIYERNLQVRK